MVLFSIIIPTYNRAAFIQKAVDSVLTQTYSNWELIIIDDASSDDTAVLLQSYTDERIHIYRNDKNLERSASRNKGIASAEGEYICFLDSDDYFLPNHLTLLADAIKKTDGLKALLHTDVEQYNRQENTRKIVTSVTTGNKVESILTQHIPVISVAVHRDILATFQFDTSLNINEDVYLFARIAACFPVVHVPNVSVVWVLHGSNTADVEKDCLTPQVIATRKIVNDPLLARFISSAFKKNKYFQLYSQLVYFHASHRRHWEAMRYFLKGCAIAPWEKNNKTNFLNVVYHLPGGQAVKKIMHLLN
ncbi:MAG TPA: glycosyltransferase family 2 protein [Cytophagaceae bacterium]|jgi:glycosyltransferase involved in cell wall biosynthesis|nr:glycosyltransferase family 2 protein [Cytophagaceae bacterium]